MDENETVEGQEENVVADGDADTEPDASDAAPDTGTDDAADDSANAVADADDESATSDVAPDAADEPDPTEGTVPEILERVGDDLEAAAAVLAAESAKDNPRSTLVEPLQEMLDNAAPVPVAAPAPESMTDRVQGRMVSSIAVGRKISEASKARNLERKRQQQISLDRTNRPDNEPKSQAEVEGD